MSKLFQIIHSSPTATRRLFCFHHAGGSASTFRSWGKLFDQSTEIIAVQLPGRENRFSEEFYSELQPLITQLILEIQKFNDIPYFIFGHSMGALISYELLQQIQNQHLPMPNLYMPSGFRAPTMPRRSVPMHTESNEKFVERLKNYGGTPKEILSNEDLLEILIPLMRADFKLADTYVFNKNNVRLNCPIHAFTGTLDEIVNELELISWKELTSKDFSYNKLEGGHFFIKSAENELIHLIKEKLDQFSNN